MAVRYIHCLSANVATVYAKRLHTFPLLLSISNFFDHPFHFLGMKQIMSSNAVHVQLMNNYYERMNVVDDEGKKQKKEPFARPFFSFIEILLLLEALCYETVVHVCARVREKWVRSKRSVSVCVTWRE